MKTAGKAGTPIASGRTADIFLWGEDEVVKLFHSWVPLWDVECERRKASVVHALGLSTPAVHGLVHRGGRVGLVFERIVGQSMLEELLANPDSSESLGRHLAGLHKQLHRKGSPRELPAQGDMLKAKISRRSELDRTERAALLDAITRLARDDILCHGDFHPGNVMLTEGSFVIIDWLDASRGHPLADVARTSLLMLEHIQHGTNEGTLREALERHRQAYLQEYMQDDPALWSEYEGWWPIVAAARLSEGIEGRQQWLLRQVRQGLTS